jgi:hypothetical protein
MANLLWEYSRFRRGDGAARALGLIGVAWLCFLFCVSAHAQNAKKQTETWRAQWIWFPEDANANPFVHRYFIKSFVLHEDAKKATLQFAADDSARVYVNGKVVRRKMAALPNSNVYEISDLLARGENIIAADVSQGRYAAGLLLETDIVLESEKRLAIQSDASWRVAKTAPEGWAQPQFSPDENWLAAQVLGAPPMAPWGEIPYRYFGPRTEYSVQSRRVPQQIAAGQSFAPEVQIRLDEDFSHDVDAKFIIEKKGVEFYALNPEGPQSSPAWKKGELVSLRFAPAVLNSFLPVGDYDIALDIPFAQVAGASQSRTPLGTLRVTNDKKTVAARAEIKPLRDVPTIFLDDTPTFGMAYQGRPADDRKYLRAQYADFARQGVNILKVIAAPKGGLDLWEARDTFNFSIIDKYILDVLAANPGAKINLVLPMASWCPAWWKTDHPDELTIFDNGKRASAPSLFSALWRRDASLIIENVVRHVQSAPYRERVICYTLGEGAESQWLSWWNGGDVRAPDSQGDYSAPALAAFRVWLRARYGDDAALQNAWKNPNVTLQSATIPTKSERLRADFGTLQDPAQGRAVADYLLCLSDTVADGVNAYGATVKRTDGGVLTAALYGHVLDVANYYLIQDGGYLSAERVLDAPAIDILVGPIAYHRAFRDVGGVASIDFPPPASLALRGKIWMNEEDVRTHLDAPGGYRYSAATAQDSIAVMQREFANVWCNRAMLYWYNLGAPRAWFDDPQLMKTIGELNRIAAENLRYSRRSRAQIAVVVEPKSFAYAKPMMPRSEQTELMTDLMFAQREQIARLGAPVDFHLASDFLRADMPDYKLVIFLNTLYLSAPERAAIVKRLDATGATALWFYAPGVITEDAFSLQAASQLTGITLGQAGSTPIPEIALQDDVFPGAPRRFGMTKSPGLVCYADDAAAQIWGTLNIENKTGLCIKTIGKRRSIFCSVPVMPAEILRQIARESDVHIYNASDDALYACENFVALHSKSDGEKTIALPYAARVMDVFENKIIAESADVIRFQSPGRDTRMFRIERAQKP